MQFKPFITSIRTLFFLLVPLNACGALTRVSFGEPSDHLESTSLESSGGEAALNAELIEPVVAGAPWGRRLQVLSADPAFWTVEKQIQGEEAWRSIGFTDAQGFFLDEHIEREARYRFGMKNESKVFPAIQDFVWTQSACVEKVRAWRIVVPQGAVVHLGKCDLSLEAEILQIEGDLRSFTEHSTGGASAGLMLISAREIRGNGQIAWVGQNGAAGFAGTAGARGANGTYDESGDDGGNGQNGGAGQNGGNGGSLTIFSPDKQFDNILLHGGLGGAGGQGGAGGAGGNRSCGVNYATDRYSCGRDGKPGRAGQNGAPGVSGSSGKVTRFERSA